MLGIPLIILSVIAILLLIGFGVLGGGAAMATTPMGIIAIGAGIGGMTLVLWGYGGLGLTLGSFGIVAAVLGIVITMSSIGGPIEVLGQKVAAALVGTFLGILMAYAGQSLIG